MKRVFLIVLDSLGIGAAPDAAAYGDEGCHTLRSVAASPCFSAPNLLQLGLGHIEGLEFLPASPAPRAAYGRMMEQSAGKDTTTGHWELAGALSKQPMPTYPEGFPREIIDAFTAATGRGVLCNRPYSGTEVIRDYGKEHLETGKLIVYTSADSVFQIAAHEALIPPETLYGYCRAARQILQGEHAVGRVIARPFTGQWPYTRTANRHDFSLVPPRTLLNDLQEAGKDVIGVGKIGDIFAMSGLTQSIPTRGNTDGLTKTLALVAEAFEGLCFVNLVDFDSQYGHRQDPDGYARALAEFDAWLPEFLAKLGPEDGVILTADHGCDPSDQSTDHTREYVPLLVWGVEPQNLGTKPSFSYAASLVKELLGME